MLNTTSPEIQFAIHTVRQASLLVKYVQAEMVSPALTKDDRSPVTVADFAAQALVGSLLETHFPDDPLIGEEDSAALGTPQARPTLEHIAHFVDQFAPGATPESVCEWIDRGSAESAARFWTLDPIDGTKGFLRGDQYAVALALVVDGDVQVAVLGCPNLDVSALISTLTPALSQGEREQEFPSHLGRGARGEGIGEGAIIVAARGQGTWVAPINGESQFTQIHVSPQSDPSQARILRSFESGHTNVGKIDHFAEALGVQAAPVRMDSQAKYAVLAAGQGELYLRLLSAQRPDYREKIWDQAAGALVIEEAGGKVTDLDGQPLDFTRGRTLAANRGICVSNGVLHEKAMQALKSIQA